LSDLPGQEARPTLSIVIGARLGERGAAACIDALAPQVDDELEVILAVDRAGVVCPAWAKEVVRPNGLVPELWAAGIDQASGRLIGLLASTTVPEDGWVASTRAAHGDDVAILGGAIEPGDGLSIVDWAVYFCRYSPYMRPLGPADGLEVPGDNASYDGDVLRQYGAMYRTGFWEPMVHQAMRADGHRQAFCEGRIVRAAAGARASTFRRQRLAHGREHGRGRAAGVSQGRTLLGLLTAPVVPLLMTARAARTVFAKRRLRARFLAASPLILWFYTWWAIGEMNGRLDAIRGRNP